MPLTIWTIGHSTRTAAEFRAVLAIYDIELVVDVRRFPGSRRWPHFGAAALERDLPRAGILYHMMGALGGRRRPSPDSVNTGWRHPAFRGYADYVHTEEFAQGLTELLGAAYGLRTAIMCSELLWWHCHRRIVADVLVSAGIEVIHIRDLAIAERHVLRLPANVVRGVLTYPTLRTP